MSQHQKKGGKLPFVVSIGVSVFLVVWGLLFLEGVTPDLLMHRIGSPLFRLFVFISLGLVAGQILEATGWTRYLARLAAPLFRFAGLGDRCSAAFTTAFVSGVAANAMLYGFWQDGAISRRQLYLANLLNQFPAYFLHLPTTFFIVVPLTGSAGITYFALTFTALFIRTLFLLVIGHFSFAGEKAKGDAPKGKQPVAKTFSAIRKLIRKRFPARIRRIMTWVMPIYVAVFLLHKAGGFDFLNTALARLAISHFIPAESLSVIVLGFTAEFSSGFAAAGAFLDAGVLTVKQTALALLVGNVVAFPIRAIRHQLPRYAGIFSPVMGTKILLLGQGLRIASLIVTGIGYYLLMP